MVARYATPRITTAGVKRGLKAEPMQIGPSVNEAEGRYAEIILRRFGRDRRWWTEVLLENVGGWSEIIFDCDPMRFNTTGFVRSSSPYHPRGAPIFPVRQKK